MGLHLLFFFLLWVSYKACTMGLIAKRMSKVVKLVVGLVSLNTGLEHVQYRITQGRLVTSQWMGEAGFHGSVSDSHFYLAHGWSRAGGVDQRSWVQTITDHDRSEVSSEVRLNGARRIACREREWIKDSLFKLISWSKVYCGGF